MYTLFLLLLLIYSPLHRSSNNNFTFIQQDTVSFIDPKYPLKFPNITVGAAYVLRGPNYLTRPDVYYLLGNVCAMRGYNEGKLQSLFNNNMVGQFNFEGAAMRFDDPNTGKVFMDYLATNLDGIPDTYNSSFKDPISAILGNAISYNFYNFVPYFYGYRIPTIGYRVSSSSSIPQSSNALPLFLSAYSFHEIGSSTGRNIFSSGLNILNAFNWSLVTALFTDDDFGYVGQELFEYFSFSEANISVACKRGLPGKITSDEAKKAMKQFTNCIKNADRLSVVILWMKTTDAYEAIKWFRVNGYSHLNFIVPFIDRVSNLEFGKFAEPEIFENVIFLKNLVSPYSQNLLEECVADLPNDTYYHRLGSFIKECATNENAEFHGCNLDDPNEVCHCTPELTTYYQSQTSYFAFAFDSVSVLANAVSLLQNNCTYLNDFFAPDPTYIKDGVPDFCKLTEISPKIISLAIEAVNFTGLTGPISFNKGTPARTQANWAYIQLYANYSQSQLGTIIDGVFTVDVNNVTYANGKIPISAIVPQIPDLSFWFVDVFFGTTCFLIFVTFVLWFLITFYSETPYIKKCSPLFMAMLSIGIFQVLIGNIIFSIGLTNSTMCILNNFFLVSGITFIISSILAKNYRIYRIFTNPQATAIQLQDHTLFQFLLILVIITWSFWAITSFADGPIIVVYESGVDNRFYTYGICQVKSSWFQTFQIIAWYVYFVGLFLIAGILGFLTRHARDVFNESANVTITTACYIAFAAIFGPLYYIQSNTTNSNNIRWVIQAMSVNFLSVITIVLLLGHPLWRAFKFNRIAAKRARRMSN